MTADNAIIIFSRLPIGQETKTRLAPIFNETQRERLHLAMWQDIFSELVKLRDTDIFLYWTGSGDIKNYLQFIPAKFYLRHQEGCNLGEKMKNAIHEIFSGSYKRALIIGADIPSMRAANLERAFNVLNNSDVVIGPSEDGGYWLIGMKKFIPDAFNIATWGNSSVLESTIKSLKNAGISYNFADILNDLDTPDDIKNFHDENLMDRVTCFLGDAATFSFEEKFDLIFIDGPKAQYIKFFERFKNNLAQGGAIISDNLSFHGMVEDISLTHNYSTKKLIKKIRKYIQFLKDNTEFKTEFYSAGDGIAVSKRLD